MKLTVHAFLTLDGVMQGPGSPDEDVDGGFSAGGWLVPYQDEVMGEIVDSWFTRAAALLLGRTTFEEFRGYWPQVESDDPTTRMIQSGPRYVAAREGYDPQWENTTVLSGDVLEHARALKADGLSRGELASGGPASGAGPDGRDGELQVHGSWRLATALHEAGLVDEYRLLIFPVTVGAGKRLFTEGAPPRGYRIIETRTTSTGAVYVAAQPGEFRRGTFEVQDGQDTARLL